MKKKSPKYDISSKRLKKGQIIYIQYETGQYVLQGDVVAVPVKETYDPNSETRDSLG